MSQIGHFYKEEISFLSQSSIKNITVQFIIASRLTSPNSQYLLSNPKMSEIGHFYKEEIFFFRILSQKYNSSTYHRF